jgi:hypothetical protein
MGKRTVYTSPLSPGHPTSFWVDRGDRCYKSTRGEQTIQEVCVSTSASGGEVSLKPNFELQPICKLPLMTISEFMAKV